MLSSNIIWSRVVRDVKAGTDFVHFIVAKSIRWHVSESVEDISNVEEEEVEVEEFNEAENFEEADDNCGLSSVEERSMADEVERIFVHSLKICFKVKNLKYML